MSRVCSSRRGDQTSTRLGRTRLYSESLPPGVPTSHLGAHARIGRGARLGAAHAREEGERLVDRSKPHAQGRVAHGDVTQRVGVEQIGARGVNVDELIEKLVDAAGAEFTTYYYYTILRMYLAGHEDYKEICEDARLEDRAHFELITPRIYELGGTIPYDIRTFADRAGCPDAYLPGSQEGQRLGSNPRDIVASATA